jgi:hypothetical protein
MRSPKQQLSARATGYLFDCVALGTKPTIDSLWKRYAEGRGAVTTALEELEQYGYLKREVVKVGNRPQTQCTITDEGYNYIYAYVAELITGLPKNSSENTGSRFLASNIGELLQHTSNSTLVSKTIKRNSPDGNEDFETQVIDVSGWNGLFDSSDSSSDDEVRELQKLKLTFDQQRFEEKERVKQQQRATGDKGRFNKPTKLWSVENVGYEFVDRVENLFNIPPWRNGKDKFIKALATQRRLNSTNGEVELAMMDMFFLTIKQDRFENGEHLWRRWFQLWPQLLPQVKGSVQTQDQIDTAKAQAERSQEKLRG